MSRYSSVDIVTSIHRMKDRGNLGSIAKVRRYSVLQNFRTGCGVHVAPSLEDATVKTAAACH
jgi:hypothetical protein